MENLLTATRNQLRTSLTALFPSGQANKYIDIEPEGRPPAWMGDFYIGVDDGGVSASGKDWLKEIFSIDITITKRTGQFAPDRLDEIYTQAARGLRAIERPIIAAVHSNQTIRTAANTLAGTPGSSTGDAYTMPLFYQGRSPIRFKGGDWNGSTKDTDCFAVRVLRFRGGDRTQDVGLIA